MSALKFKIKNDRLVLIDWKLWEEEDQRFIVKCLDENFLDYDVTTSLWEQKVVITGKAENFFKFLHDVAFRYDIEII